MDYKKELKKMERHRKRYRPVMDMLVKLHGSSGDFPVELIDHKDIMILLELLDVGYLDTGTFIVKSRFDDVVGLVYTGKYPFTESGDRVYKERYG